MFGDQLKLITPQVLRPCGFIFSVQFLKPWKWVEMDDGHNMKGKWIVVTSTNSSSLTERFTCYLYKGMIVFVYSSYQRKRRIEKSMVLYWNSKNAQPPIPLAWVVLFVTTEDRSHLVSLPRTSHLFNELEKHFLYTWPTWRMI